MPAPIVFDAFARNLAAGFVEHDLVHMPTAFQRFFGRAGSLTVYSPDANALDIDVVRANQRIAALIPRGIGRSMGTNRPTGQVNRGAAFSRSYPLIEEEVDLEGNQLLSRVIGYEGPYDRASRQDRLRYLARHGYQELIRRNVRTFEFLAAQSIILGLQSAETLVAAPGVNDYDWRRAATHTVTLAQGWGNALGVPLTDIDAACDLVAFDGKAQPDGLILDRTSLVALMANAQFNAANYPNKFFYDLVRFTMDYRAQAKFQPFIDGGFKAFGQLRTPQGYDLTVFTYPEFYTNAGGVQTPYLPAQAAVLFATGARCDRYFGPPERIPVIAAETAEMMELFGFNPNTAPLPPNAMGGESVLSPAMFYPDFYRSEDRKHVTVRVQSAPVFAPQQVDAFLFWTNAGAP